MGGLALGGLSACARPQRAQAPTTPPIQIGVATTSVAPHLVSNYMSQHRGTGVEFVPVAPLVQGPKYMVGGFPAFDEGSATIPPQVPSKTMVDLSNALRGINFNPLRLLPNMLSAFTVGAKTFAVPHHHERLA